MGGDDDDLERGAEVTAVLLLLLRSHLGARRPFLEQAGSFWEFWELGVNKFWELGGPKFLELGGPVLGAWWTRSG